MTGPSSLVTDWVVWEDETPSYVYPPLPKRIEPLAECRELQNYPDIRRQPRPRRLTKG